MLTLLAAVSVVLLIGAALYTGVNRLLRRFGVESKDDSASNVQLLSARLEEWRARRSAARGGRID